jgi:hypothetical protein
MKPQSAQRRERLAAALRENLRRRKAAVQGAGGAARGRGKDAVAQTSKSSPGSGTKGR